MCHEIYGAVTANWYNIKLSAKIGQWNSSSHIGYEYLVGNENSARLQGVCSEPSVGSPGEFFASRWQELGILLYPVGHLSVRGGHGL